MESEEIKKYLTEIIKNNPDQFPLIAQNWSFFIHEDYKLKPPIEFGKYGSKLTHSYPFYKAYSKIIDPEKLK